MEIKRKRLFKVVTGIHTHYFRFKVDAKIFREDNGGKLSLGPDHIGPHGNNRVNQHMRNKRTNRYAV